MPNPLALRLENNLWKMKAIRFLWWAHFFAAVLVPFFRDWGGLDYTRIMLLNAWFWFWNFLLEVPTGTIADVFGRKVSIALSGFTAMVATLLYGSTPSFAVFLLAEAIFAVAMTLASGADEALVYDTLTGLGREDEAQETYARLQSIKVAGILFGALIGAPIAAAWGLRAPMLVQAIPFALSGLLALSLAEPGGRRAPSERPPYFETLFTGVRYFRGHAELRVLAFDMVGAGVLSFLVIWFYQPQLERAGIGVAAFGAVHAGMCVAQILVLRNVERLEWLSGSKRSYLFLSALAPGLAFLVLGAGGGAFPTVSAIVFAAAFGLSRPTLFLSYMNRHIPGAQRATVLSAISMLRTFAAALLNPIAGLLADWSMPAALFLFGAATIAVAVVARVGEGELAD